MADARDEPDALSLVDLADGIRSGRLSSEEIVRAHLDRIEAVNPRLNAVVQLRRDAAIDEAVAADRAPRERRGLLHGVPITVKDSFDTAGIISTGGLTGRASFVPLADATVVKRLRAAGAIILGKTNTPDLTLSGETNNPVYGRTSNPYDLTRTPGGSSGGAAAIIAAGGSPLDIGTDTGGSIRMPAHFCGIVGIKPTAGRVPRTGHIINFEGAAESLTHVGPLARRVDDLAFALSIIAGPDDIDPHIPPVALGDRRRVTVRELRIAYFIRLGSIEPTEATASAVEQAVRMMEKAGCRARAVSIPGASDIYEDFVGLMWSDGGAWAARLLAQWSTTESPLFDRIRQSAAEPSGKVTARFERWDRWRSEMLRMFADHDVILGPIYPEPAPRHGGWLRQQATFSQIFNLTGWPSTAVRAGTSPEGLPIGVQCVAHPWREDVSLAVARHLETACGPFPRPVMTGF